MSDVPRWVPNEVAELIPEMLAKPNAGWAHGEEHDKTLILDVPLMARLCLRAEMRPVWETLSKHDGFNGWGFVRAVHAAMDVPSVEHFTPSQRVEMSRTFRARIEEVLKLASLVLDTEWLPIAYARGKEQLQSDFYSLFRVEPIPEDRLELALRVQPDTWLLDDRNHSIRNTLLALADLFDEECASAVVKQPGRSGGPGFVYFVRSMNRYFVTTFGRKYLDIHVGLAAVALDDDSIDRDRLAAAVR